MAATRSIESALEPASVLAGSVRPGRRTKLLVRHLVRGDVALIDHLDIDRVSAEELIAAGAVAVLNCSPSSGGSYPNLGPQLLVEAGIVLVDLPDDSLFDVLSDGDPVVIRVHAGAADVDETLGRQSDPAGAAGPAGAVGHAGAMRSAHAEVLRKGELLAVGEVLDLERVCAETETRRREIGEALERFAHNTIEHMREERELLAGRIQLPRFATDFRDRSTLVVVRGVGHQRDLRALRPFIRDMRPLIIAVDGGADAVLEAGLTPSMIVGDMDSAGEAALRCGAELVVHSYPDGRAPGRHRVEELGLPFKLVPAPGTSQDVAMLIAAEKGARLIVSVGSQFNLVEFLDRNRKGMSSTFLTRLRIGEILVDAKGVSRLYQPRPGLTPLLVVIVTGLIAMIAVVWITPALRDVAELLWLKLQMLFGAG
ncbi:MAG: putative cytokinetic ring protein SteA [Solirubrobacteraceae bacterium]